MRNPSMAKVTAPRLEPPRKDLPLKHFSLFRIPLSRISLSPIIKGAGYSRVALRRLKWLATIAPLGFLVALEFVRHLYLQHLLSYPTSQILAIAVMIPAAYLFSHLIFAIITRMEQEILRRNEHLAAMNQILTAVSQSLDLDHILQVALNQLLEVMDLKAGMVALLDRDTQELSAVANRGIPLELAQHAKRIKLADALLEQEVVRSGKPVVVENLINDPRVMDVAKRAGFQSLVCMPLKSKGVVEGLLGMASREMRKFSQSDIDLLMATGSQIAMAIENARLFAETRQQSERLRILNEVGISLTAEHSLEGVLQKIVDLSRELVGARYGALALLEGDGRIGRFITSGLSAEERERIGTLPKGLGLLRTLWIEGKPLHVSDIAKDPRSVGFPPHHPRMKTLLGIPIRSKGRIIGTLYLTDKLGGEEFTLGDQEALETLAAQSAVAIEKARLYAQLQGLTMLQERERIAMDLHDGVIQSLYAVGLSLEGCAEMVRGAREDVAGKIERGVDDLNEVIKDIRNYIFDLRPNPAKAKGIAEALEEVLRVFRVNSLIGAELVAEEAGGVTQEKVVQLTHIAQEALANVMKHARASQVLVRVSTAGGGLILSIRDNGIGFDPEVGEARDGQGLRNMAGRASALGGTLRIHSDCGGTEVIAEIPLTSEGG